MVAIGTNVPLDTGSGASSDHKLMLWEFEAHVPTKKRGSKVTKYRVDHAKDSSIVKKAYSLGLASHPQYHTLMAQLSLQASMSEVELENIVKTIAVMCHDSARAHIGTVTFDPNKPPKAPSKIREMRNKVNALHKAMFTPRNSSSKEQRSKEYKDAVKLYKKTIRASHQEEVSDLLARQTSKGDVSKKLHAKYRRLTKVGNVTTANGDRATMKYDGHD